MAELFVRGNTIWISYWVAGKRIRKSLELVDNQENRVIAKKIKKEIEYKAISGELIEKIKRYSELKISEGFTEFIETKNGRSERTKEMYSYCFQKLISICGDKKIRVINDDEIRRFEEGLNGLSKNTIEIIFRHLRQIFNEFIKRKYIAENPFKLKPTEETRKRIISDKEMDFILYLLKKQNKNHYRIIKLLSLTGLRISELLRIDFEDIDFKRKIILIRNEKGKRIDEFPLYPQLSDFIQENFEIKRCGRLFEYRSKDSLKFFGKFLKRNGLNHYSFHDFRKTFLTNLVNRKVSIYDLQIIARHKDIRTTKKYYLEADLQRIGNEINQIILDTFKDTKKKVRAEYSLN